MIDPAVVGAAGVLMFANHKVADYWLQTDYQAQAKGTKGWFGKALWTHIAIYSLSFIWVAAVLWFNGWTEGWKALILPIVIGLPHVLTDERSILTWFCEATKGWRSDGKVLEQVSRFSTALRDLSPMEQIVRFHVKIELDQSWHMLCLALTALWLAA